MKVISCTVDASNSAAFCCDLENRQSNDAMHTDPPDRKERLRLHSDVSVTAKARCGQNNATLRWHQRLRTAPSIKQRVCPVAKWIRALGFFCLLRLC